jgi:hypothetical protein
VHLLLLVRKQLRIKCFTASPSKQSGKLTALETAAAHVLSCLLQQQQAQHA